MTAPDRTPAWACRCPSCITLDAITLLEGGRPEMALSVLRGLHESVAEAVGEAYAQGLADGRRAAAKGRTAGPVTRETAAPKAKPAGPGKRLPAATQLSRRRDKVPAHSRVAAELREYCGAHGADKVAALLGVEPRDLGPLLAGRVAPPASGMRRLRETMR